MANNRYVVDYDKMGRAECKRCKFVIGKETLRIGKLVTNPFSRGDKKMAQWYHVECIFESFRRARVTTKIITKPEDLQGWEDIQEEHKELILKYIKDFCG